MFKGLKINIAIIICVAFLFRLLSLSLSFVSSSNESNSLASTSYTYLAKKGSSLVESEKNSTSVFTDLVFSEEDPDDENEYKSFTPVLLEYFSGLVVCCIGNHVKATTPSNKHFAYNSSQRRIEFGVFRI
ncbi:MAG: hypothetical protein KBG47_01145 [Bacteroidia bacterium]|nr:hypothetical protein [Bacteroidia bacterium]